jgi:hypothetical protein
MSRVRVKTPQRSEDEILDQATQQLLKATKQEAKKRGKPINDESLRREGYSERFIDRVRKALRHVSRQCANNLAITQSATLGHLNRGR